MAKRKQSNSGVFATVEFPPVFDEEVDEFIREVVCLPAAPGMTFADPAAAPRPSTGYLLVQAKKVAIARGDSDKDARAFLRAFGLLEIAERVGDLQAINHHADAARAAFGMMRLRPAEPLARRGRDNKRDTDEGGRVRREAEQPRWNEWQAVANRIWHEHPKMSVKAVARMVVNHVGGNFETIRKRIKKPL